MSDSGPRRRRLWRTAAGAVGVAAAGAAAGAAISAARQHRAISRTAGEHIALGSLHSPARHVIAADGVPLHVEVDDVDPETGDAFWGAGTGAARRRRQSPPVTVVFAHGYCLNLDCWHFQRAAYRGLVRTVFYDQRSHGRSGRSDREHATIEQLGRDLKQILDEVVPDGPVVLVGHSMGGMTIVALAESHPELFAPDGKVIGVGLISTTAGGLDPGRVLIPLLPARISGVLAGRTIAALQRGHLAVDQVRRVGAVIANSATHRFAFGGEVPRAYVRFVDAMLAATPFEVVADFFPSFGSLDKFDHVEVLDRVPTSIICGTADRLTSVGHSRKLHSRIPTSNLVECPGAGHMVLIERHDQVNAELDQLITAATTRAAAS